MHLLIIGIGLVSAFYCVADAIETEQKAEEITKIENNQVEI